jgi:formylglycine-generating enzyme required for sulfatase activity
MTKSIVRIEMNRIPAGAFIYGKEIETLELTEFWIGKSPVTNRVYAHCVAATEQKQPKRLEKERYVWSITGAVRVRENSTTLISPRLKFNFLSPVVTFR